MVPRVRNTEIMYASDKHEMYGIQVLGKPEFACAPPLVVLRLLGHRSMTVQTSHTALRTEVTSSHNLPCSVTVRRSIL